jgi:hypothetical protein
MSAGRFTARIFGRPHTLLRAAAQLAIIPPVINYQFT